AERAGHRAAGRPDQAARGRGGLWRGCRRRLLLLSLGLRLRLGARLRCCLRRANPLPERRAHGLERLHLPQLAAFALRPGREILLTPGARRFQPSLAVKKLLAQLPHLGEPKSDDTGVLPNTHARSLSPASDALDVALGRADLADESPIPLGDAVE